MTHAIERPRREALSTTCAFFELHDVNHAFLPEAELRMLMETLIPKTIEDMGKIRGAKQNRQAAARRAAKLVDEARRKIDERGNGIVEMIQAAICGASVGGSTGRSIVDCCAAALHNAAVERATGTECATDCEEQVSADPSLLPWRVPLGYFLGAALVIEGASYVDRNANPPYVSWPRWIHVAQYGMQVGQLDQARWAVERAWIGAAPHDRAQLIAKLQATLARPSSRALLDALTASELVEDEEGREEEEGEGEPGDAVVSEAEKQEGRGMVDRATACLSQALRVPLSQGGFIRLLRLHQRIQRRLQGAGEEGDGGEEGEGGDGLEEMWRAATASDTVRRRRLARQLAIVASVEERCFWLAESIGPQWRLEAARMEGNVGGEEDERWGLGFSHKESWMTRMETYDASSPKVLLIAADPASQDTFLVSRWGSGRGEVARVEIALEELRALLAENDASMEPAEKNEWWERRGKLDEAWKAWLGDEGVNNTLLEMLNDAPRRGSRRPRRRTRAAAKAEEEAEEGSGLVALVLGETCHGIPWESFDALRDRTVVRVPALPFLWREEAEPSGNEHFFRVDPDGSLRKTAERIGDWISRVHLWRGVIGSHGEEDEDGDPHEADIYLYCGHGAGEKWRKNLQSTRIELLMGCSSAKLKDKGSYEPVGAILYRLAAGTRSVVGNLWDVTDRDLDRYTIAVLCAWLGLRPPDHPRSGRLGESRGTPSAGAGEDEEEGEEAQEGDCHAARSSKLSVAVSKGRDGCRLPFAVGAAPVCYAGEGNGHSHG